MELSEALNTNSRVRITYTCGGVHIGYVRKGYIYYNKRGIIGTKVEPSNVQMVQYTLGKMIIWVRDTNVFGHKS